MTMGQEPGAERKFAPDVLPWIVAAAALAVYLLTLNHWVSLAVLTFNPWPCDSLSQTARLAGWNWQPELSNPVYFVVTYPIRWLSGNQIPMALNLFSAACAAATLGLLARSVAILPQDRTDEQRQREQSEHSTLSIPLAWIPPVLAAVVCGLQLTFWEHATNGTQEMFDLLLFVFVIWSLLEYRLDRRESRLTWAALVYGAAMTENWAMIGFFPVFIASLICLRKLSFFNPRFLGRMALCGISGLLLYLLLPLLVSLSDTVHLKFWDALRLNAGLQKYAITSLLLNKYALFQGEKPLWIVALWSLLPALAMSIRWPSYFGDSSRLGVLLATSILHLVSAVLLVVCVWVAFDPAFSPRHFIIGIPFLTLYLLGALSAGYFSGYFLLLASARPVHSWRASPWPDWAGVLAKSLVVALLAVALTGLAWVNLPAIRASNGKLLDQFAARVDASLPRQGAILLSDDSRRLFLAEASLTRRGEQTNYLLLDTQSLKWPAYHRFLHAKYPSRWPAVARGMDTNTVSDIELINLMGRLVQSDRLYYLHPSFGYYFEYFDMEPHGLVYRLNLRPPSSLLAPLPSKEIVAENEAFWTQVAAEAIPTLPRLLVEPAFNSGSAADRFLKALHATRDPNFGAAVIGAFYSRALNYWGVERQRAGDLEAAAGHFETALKLNPENVVARVNLSFNENLRAGRHTPVPLSKSVEDQFGKYRGWNEVITENGPFDEPGFCYEQGRVFLQTGILRQSAESFSRAIDLAPDNFAARLTLAQLSVMADRPDDALHVLSAIHQRPQDFQLTATNRADVAFTEASAYLVRSNFAQANQVMETAYAKDPANEMLLNRLLQVYLAENALTNALDVLNRRLKMAPNDTASLMNKGYVCIWLKAYNDAAAALTRALELQPNNPIALLNRAIAYLCSNRLDEARRDYEALEKATPRDHRVYYGLAEIASRAHDTNTAIHYYESYLANADTNSPESKSIRRRLTDLQGVH